MQDFPIAEIKIGTRIRKDYGNVEEMAASLNRFGQIQPIVLDAEGNLIAGGRRLEGAKQLGWSTIKAILREELDEVEKRELELEENIRRKELSWVEEIVALNELYALRQDRYGKPGSRFAKGEGYGVEAAAEELERSTGSVSMDLQLARALKEFPQLAQEKTKSAALKRYIRERKTQLRTEQARRTHLDADADHRPDGDDERDTEAGPGASAPIRQRILKTAWKGHGILYLADARDVLRLLPKGSVDCIVTDPPFGLGMFKEGQTTGGARLAEQAGHMYDDDPYEIMNMLDEVFMYAAQVLKPDGHVYCFFHMTRYEEVFLMLRKHFGTCEETPIIWAKNTPGIGDPNANWVYSYEPCFFVNRGRHLVKPQAFNVLKQYDTVPPRSKIHPTEKPAGLLRHLVSASCVAKELVLDPFAGSGSTLVAAHQCGCRFYGVEREEQFHRSAVQRISEEIAVAGTADADQNTYQTAADLKEEA